MTQPLAQSEPHTVRSTASVPRDETLKGIALGALGYALFSVQDAAVKWLLAGFAVPQILFVRSAVIIMVAFAISGRTVLPAIRATRSRGALGFRAALILGAWLLYYSAARHLELAQMTTIYFAAPIVAVLLAVVVLRERVSLPRYLAVGAGFVGVVLAANPGAHVDATPALMAFAAACCWGLSVVLARVINRSEPTTNQMVVSNALFLLACGVLSAGWRWPDPRSLALMIGIGLAGGCGQFVLYEGFRYAPASALAPIEYTGLVWAFVYGYLIWAEVPQLHVMAGAVLIVVASLLLIWVERRRATQAGDGSK